MDSSEIAEKTNAMWLSLGEQIAAAIPDIVIDSRPQDAIRWATYAEACFWKATGESATHDVNDVLATPSSGSEG